MQSESEHIGFPLLSLEDPEDEGGTSLDPLGLTPIGEQLAVDLVPGVRERQVYPRYLTAIAVSLEVCRGFDPDELATDGVSESWQVFEWYVVEGLVRSAGTGGEARVPGSMKARKALSQNLPLSARRYLKSPSIFGFHGVYRLLSRTLRVEQAGYLADFGFELLDVWQKEQGLPGFHGSSDGPGKSDRQKLVEAVRLGLKAGATVYSAAWFGWKFFFDHLEPTKSGPREAELIWRQLKSGLTGFGGEILDFLVSKHGQALSRNDDVKEKEIYSVLKKAASAELRDRVETIERYEHFCRLLQDAFDACRYEITQVRQGVSPAGLSRLKPVVRAAERLQDAYCSAEESFPDLDRRTRFQLVFQDVAQKRSPAEFVEALYEHHRRVQKAKPPDGKARWIEQHTDGTLLIRPDYRLDESPKMSTEFVNPYRIRPLWNFAASLQQV